MNNNPLFPQNDPPTDGTPAPASDDAAVRLIREKVARAYAEEPNAVEELAETQTRPALSKHQLYMQELSSSGKSLADIQTAWHHYYTMLPDNEKHEVWQEFYAANTNTPYQKLFQKQQPGNSRRVVQPISANTSPLTEQAKPALPALNLPDAAEQNRPVVSITPEATAKPVHNQYSRPTHRKENVRELKKKIVSRVSAGGKLKAKHHLQSLLFGLGTGALVLVVLLFSFFNEYVIAPFIQPGRTVSATPIILSDTATVASSTPQVLIPKINVQIPLVFNLTSNEEEAVQAGLEEGVVHYPSTALPGQNGNSAFFGHSSNNIFNPGKYKFAFVLLRTLTTGDVFYLTYNGKAYAYQVFAREVVDPSQVSVLTDTKGKQATAALITCDPPGTTSKRLVVWGEQISPSPSTNAAPQAAPVSNTTPTALASNGPSLWNRLTNALSFWN